MITIRSTQNCVNTPGILFALEEAGVRHVTATVPDGTFTQGYGLPGPAYVESEGDEAWTLVETLAIQRHIARAHGAGTLWPLELRRQAEVDRWIEFVGRRVSRGLEAVRTGGDPAAVLGLLGRLDTLLAGGQAWLVGDFTIADCVGASLRGARPLIPAGTFPHLVAYLDRLAARPAYVRVFGR